MISSDSDEVRAFWREFCGGSGVDESSDYHARTFSDPVFSTVTDVIAELARVGNKRGTCHLLLDFQRNQVPLRYPGDYMIVLNGSLSPVCVVRCTRTEIIPYNQVTDVFAASEGEGDLSYEFWDTAHERYFRKMLDAWGIPWSDRVNVVCESFVTVWPVPG